MEHEMISAKEKAGKYFKEGYNCAQAVVLTFADRLTISEKEAVMLAASFGGGMGRLREVCGAVSGMFVVLGLLCGYSEPTVTDEELEIKHTHYKRVQELAAKFQERNKSLICRELLDGVQTTEGVVPEARDAAYYARRPCEKYVEDAAEILDEYLRENQL